MDGGGQGEGLLRAIDPSSFLDVEAGDLGAAPMLQWVKVADLVVDDAYQRPVVGAGRSNVRRIAMEFRWSKFAPVICAPVAGGKFALIDGQHRATAAALLGIESIPAQVIIADTAEQAAAFKSINGQVTRMHSLALHHAALAAGDAGALALAKACSEAGVVLLRYPRQADRLEPGETLALGSIAEGLRQFGHEAVVAGLRCVTRTSNNKPGVLNAAILRAIFSLVGGHQAWLEDEGALLGVFGRTDLEAELQEAQVTRRGKGTALWEVLADRLRPVLTVALGGGPAADAKDNPHPDEGVAPLPVPPPRPPAPGRVLTAAAMRREVRGVLQTDSATAPQIAAALKVAEAAVREALRELAELGQAVADPMPTTGWQAQAWRIGAGA